MLSVNLAEKTRIPKLQKQTVQAQSTVVTVVVKEQYYATITSLISN